MRSKLFFPPLIDVAPDIKLLTSRVAYRFNSYVIGPELNTLIDAGTRWSGERLEAQLAEFRLSAIALSHCHPDHQGSAARLCLKFNVPLLCHEADADAAEGKIPMEPSNLLSRFAVSLLHGPFQNVARRLGDGDLICDGWRVVHAPGHTPGHISFFRESDGVVLAGDVLANINFITGKPHLHAPPFFFSHDASENRGSIQRLVDLKPSLVLFGHGYPLTDVGRLKRLCGRVE